MILLNDSSLDRYFRHASGEIYAISQILAHFISINRFILLLIHFLSAQKLYSTEHLNVCHPQTCRNKGKESFTHLSFLSYGRSLLRTYAHDDVTAGSWLIGIDIEHIDERKFCCSWSSGLSLDNHRTFSILSIVYLYII